MNNQFLLNDGAVFRALLDSSCMQARSCESRTVVNKTMAPVLLRKQFLLKRDRGAHSGEDD